MLAADGTLLCHCDIRKLKWYQVCAPFIYYSVDLDGLSSKATRQDLGGWFDEASWACGSFCS